ncbi:multidrug effflux MFS transporter [Novosphingobium taihuense]|uniref:Bcr/CflA family efflux transporter n=1 Tax=Novosphingobium taihuense TaxID=260085 RepID=A0A7W7A9S6_9SPHN|nr:multidrug effflux MFS transporter [Novosphingobium taihuense]MBB4612956.1 DHA1 family bicyclomycin/chloramphenicol resistance-like MFS transporter [Novosphingobium taihuense]TWH81856.1 DHA1 family bicyclomycin/chloramphenicol resistance-like MFS transporter [Novosphingobium taihuense]
MGERETIAMMALVMALQALAVDAMLPALGDIARDLDVADPNRRQLVVGSFLLASGFASLVPGSLADRYGRRPVLLACVAIYVVFSLACALVTSFDALLTMRVAQAMGCGGLAVLPGAIIRDRFSGDQMAKQMSVISVVFLVVPMLAPSIGQVVLLFAGWRWIFVFLAVMALGMGVWVFIRLPETMRPEYRQPIRPMSIAINMAAAATNRSAIGYVLGGALTFGAMIGYVNSSQQLVGEHFGAGTMFPVLFGFSALMMAAANFSNSRIVERFGARRVSHAAVILFIFVSGLQTWFSSDPDETLWQFMPLMITNMILIGFIGANFGSIALQPFERTAGTANSMHAFLRLVIGSVIGIVVGQAYDGTAHPLALALLMSGILSLLLVLFSEKGKLFRRLHPPGTPRPIVLEH